MIDVFFLDAHQLIGKCFKYRNSDGSGKKWWLYTKIVGLGDWEMISVEAQACKDDYIDIKRNTIPTSMVEGSSYIKITPKEFDKEFKKILQKITEEK